jgi:hypothetical protein
MRPGFAKIIGKICISRWLNSPQSDLYTAENTCCINYAHSCTSKQVHSLSTAQSLHYRTTNYASDDTFKLDSGVGRVSLPIITIQLGLAPQWLMQWLPATLYNTGWMNHCQVCHRRFEAIPTLDPVNVDEVYSQIASRYHRVQWYLWLYGQHYAGFG